MRRRWPASLVVLILAPSFAAAQTVNGSADWGYGRSTSRTGDQATENDSFTQAYTVGYQSILWDPRFLTYSGELTFHRNALSFGQQDGASRQTGFNASASLFPSRPFPLSVHASRAIGGETANYPTGNPIRGGLPAAGDAATALTTHQSNLGVNWQLNAAELPRVELSYQKAAAAVATGHVEALQQQTSLNALVARDGTRLRHLLRYDRQRFDNELSAAFRQRHSELAYELVANASPRTSATLRAGRRSSFSLFDVPRQLTGGDIAYRPPAAGDVGLLYGMATLTHAWSRLSTDLTASYDTERSATGSTNALLGTARTRLSVLPGFTLTGSTTYGQRGQEVASDRIRVLTQAVGGGAEYAVGFRFLQASAGYEHEAGRSTGEHGDGSSRLWRTRAHASSGVLRIVDLSVGYERGQSRDDVLDFGNGWQERTRAAARTTIGGPLTIEANWEQATVERGRGVTASRSRYLQGTGTARLTLTHNHHVSFNAGRFLNQSTTGGDSTAFAGLSLDTMLAKGLHLTVTGRREHMLSEVSRLEQAGYSATAVLEYRLRLFTFGFEQRYTDLALSTAAETDPLAFHGNQILFRVGRRFGFGL